MPYTNDPIPWEKKLVASEPANVKRAIDFFERCHGAARELLRRGAARAGGRGRRHDRRPDGRGADGGRRWNLELMVELLVEKIATAKVAFDSMPRRRSEVESRSCGRISARGAEARMVVAKLD
jgi:hypothetical protein